MNTQTDQQLLQAYAANRSEPAFAELVRRHIDLIYSAALRRIGDPHLAQDVTQDTFATLAQNARPLASHPVLSGWLHRTTQNIAANLIRTNTRRVAREQEAVAVNQLLSDSETGVPPVWSEIAPHLDSTLDELDASDRDAVILRYFEKKSASDMAIQLGISADAAQKRVSRAVERLREFFAKRGVRVGAGGLAVVISANAVQAAPAGLALTISTSAALVGIVLPAASATQTAVSTMSWINLKSGVAIGAAALVTGMGTYFVQQQASAGLREENQRLLATQAVLTRERAAAIATAAQNADELKRREADQIELLRLRGEIGPLRRKAVESDQLAEQFRQLQEAFNKLGQSVSRPDNEPETDPEKRFAMDRMNESKQLVLGLILFAADHQDMLPTDLLGISNYFGADPLNELLQNHPVELVLQGPLKSVSRPAETIAIRSKSPFVLRGKSAKVYGFADGHSEVRTEPSEGFEAWEQARLLPPPTGP